MSGVIIAREFLLVQIALKTVEHSADFIWPAQVGHGIGNGVSVFQPEQKHQPVCSTSMMW
jgi:hypothetical protein